MDKPKHFHEYLVYPDGKVWSLAYGKFLKPFELKRRPGDIPQKMVRLRFHGTEHKFTCARLVFFLFCKHKHKSISKLGPVTYKTQKRTITPTNLIEATKGEIIKRYGIRAKENKGPKPSIPPEAAEYIASLLYLGSKKEIVKRLASSKFKIQTTPMSLLRFMRRHNINP